MHRNALVSISPRMKFSRSLIKSPNHFIYSSFNNRQYYTIATNNNHKFNHNQSNDSKNNTTLHISSRISFVIAGSIITVAAYILGTKTNVENADVTQEHDVIEASTEPHLGHLNSDVLKLLSDLLGDRCSVDVSDRDSHGKDANSFHGDLPPWAVVYPLSTAEVSEILKICNKYYIPVIPYGSGTSLEGHTNAPLGGITIDVSRMNAIKELHSDDMDVVVEPGIAWGNLNEYLQPYGLFFPVDPGPGASIGGMCGTGCSGTNAVRYGTMRANVINLTAVLADGTIIKTAQRARKSSAGYNLTNLFIGSEGTLGIITEVTLRLQNIPANTAVAVCSFPSIHAAADAAIAVQRKGIQVGCVELLDDSCIRIVNSYVGTRLAEMPTLFFKFTGSEPSIKDDIRRVTEIVHEKAGGDLEWAIDPVQRAKLWEGRKGALWAAIAYKPENQVWTTDVCVPLSRLADCIEATKRDVESSGLLAPIVGHVGDGNFHVFLSINPNDRKELEIAKRVNGAMVQRAINMEGSCTGEHGVGVGKRAYLDHELGETTVEAMRKIKGALDPKGILNPGKIFPPRKGEPEGHV